jgi:DNA helicase-2/ATP-dependent DNA helicase PcrA
VTGSRGALPHAGQGAPDLPGGQPRYTPGQLARLLGLPEPTPEQARVIAAPLEPLAVVAGAGSGKSETMAARLVWLAANGLVRPERVLGLTFTRKAAAELGQRVRARLAGLRRAGVEVTWAARDGGGGPSPRAGDPLAGDPLAGNPLAGDPLAGDPLDGDPLDGEPAVFTYHAYAARLVGDHALREGLEPTLRLVTPAVAWQLAARAVAAHEGSMDKVTWGPPEVTAAVLALAGELAEHLRDPAEVRQVGEWLAAACQGLAGRVPARVRRIVDCQRAREQLVAIVSAYTRAKAAREVMDYGDQVALAARIAARHPEVGAAERARYQVVLLDEFQDTSHAQLVLLRALFGGGHPVTAVGDPCQSIYGWRGASAGNLRRFSRQFPARRAGRELAAAVLPLATSFRNTGRILQAAGRLQEGLPERAPRMRPPAGLAGRGQVVCALLESAADEARWVAEQVAALLRLPPGTAPDGRPWPEPGGRPAAASVGGRAQSRRIQPSDIAVLCRKRAQFPLLREAIAARGIPVTVAGLGGLLTVPEVADIVATLRVLYDPSASASLARLLTGPRWRIGPRDLVALGRRAAALAARDAGPGGAESAAAKAPGARGDPAAPGAGCPGPAPRPDPGPSRPVPPPGPGVGEPAAAVGERDPISAAVTDLTRDPGSLVEALDDLGDPAAYSPAAYARFQALVAELRWLRAQAGRPLPELIGEVERALCLDIEVAARPGRDPAAARADLDAFADAAAAFADGEEEPTLGAFLAYLAAAETEEFGLEPGQPSSANAVTLTTIHAAKGLQWAAVVVPGMAAGAGSQVFPAKPRATTRWTDNPRLLPFALRGDAEDLPALNSLAAESLDAFAVACSERELAEERRLAYVAVTRAAFWVACTGYWWGEGRSPLGPSVFLTEVREACEAGTGTVAVWASRPAGDAINPLLAKPVTASWPAIPSGPQHEVMLEAAAEVERALAGPAGSRPAGAAVAPGRGPDAGGGQGDGQVGGQGTGAGARQGADAGEGPVRGALSPGDLVLAQAWERDASLLLAELAERRAGSSAAVPLPAQLTVTSLVRLATDPASLAQQIRRPMPRPPAPQARRGTAFHQWLEERFGHPQLVGPADLPGAADDLENDPDSADLATLRERFEAGEWGDRWPVEAEVPFETMIAGQAVRGRIDAVFAVPGGGYDVVDWKTGEPPSSASELRAAAVQLAAYRLAWSRLAGVPLGQVRAAFYYVRHDLTLRPADLLDEAGLAALIESVPTAS